jgi:hypothetical protein
MKWIWSTRVGWFFRFRGEIRRVLMLIHRVVIAWS